MEVSLYGLPTATAVNDKQNKAAAAAAAAVTPPSADSKQCSACSAFKPRGSDFSKNQRKKPDGRCKDCINAINAPKTVGLKNTCGSMAAASEPAAKKQKVVTVWIQCRDCKKDRAKHMFPLDCDPESPCCGQCIGDSEPRACKDCGTKKSKDQFSTSEWRLPGSGLGKKTKEQILLMAQGMKQTCLDCVKVQKEKKEQEEREKQARKEQEAREKQARDKEAMEKHNVQFYDFDNPVPTLVHSSPSPKDLEGTYDVIFHAGFCQGEDIENRTTKGTAVLKMAPKIKWDNDDDDDDDDDGSPRAKTEESNLVLTGRVEFLEELRISQALLFQRDFDLSEGGNAGFQVMLIDETARDVVHCSLDDEPADLTMKRVEKRSALSWMKHERPDDNEEEGKIQFETLEQAEALAAAYEKNNPGTSSKPKPVFFLEPGDLVLSVDWTNGDEDVSSDCVLRKRQD